MFIVVVYMKNEFFSKVHSGWGTQSRVRFDFYIYTKANLLILMPHRHHRRHIGTVDIIKLCVGDFTFLLIIII